mgnify:CR=1 FL=1
MEDMKPQALKRIQTRLVLEKVAEVENIQPTEEEVNEEISKMAEAYKMEADKLKELLGERELEQMKKAGSRQPARMVDNSAKSGIMGVGRKLDRREQNIGAFSELRVPMQKREVLSLCRKYSIDTNGITFKIQRSEKLLALPFYGSTDYK